MALSSPTRRSLIGASLALLAPAGRAAAANRTLLNVSYDPTRELYREINPCLRRSMAGEDRRTPHHQSVAWRLRRTGAGRAGRAAGRCRDAGAGRRHRRAGEARLDRDGLADAAAGQCIAVHQHDRVPGAQGQPEGIFATGRTCVQARHQRVITPNPKTSGGARWNFLAALAWAQRQPGATDGFGGRFHAPAVPPGARARHRRTRRHQQLRSARASATC